MNIEQNNRNPNQFEQKWMKYEQKNRGNQSFCGPFRYVMIKFDFF